MPILVGKVYQSQPEPRQGCLRGEEKYYELTDSQHYTDATDTRTLAFVVSAVHDVIVQREFHTCLHD